VSTPAPRNYDALAVDGLNLGGDYMSKMQVDRDRERKGDYDETPGPEQSAVLAATAESGLGESSSLLDFLPEAEDHEDEGEACNLSETNKLTVEGKEGGEFKVDKSAGEGNEGGDEFVASVPLEEHTLHRTAEVLEPVPTPPVEQVATGAAKSHAASPDIDDQSLTASQAAAEAGMQSSQMQFGTLNEASKVSLVERAREGDSSAMWELARRIFIEGGDAQEAERLLAKAAENGHHAIAARTLAERLTTGAGGFRKDLPRAAKLWRIAATQSDRQGEYNFGMCLIYGWGIEKDHAKGEHWLRQAAQKGHIEAVRRLADHLAGKIVHVQLAQPERMRLIQEMRSLYCEYGKLVANSHEERKGDLSQPSAILSIEKQKNVSVQKDAVIERMEKLLSDKDRSLQELQGRFQKMGVEINATTQKHNQELHEMEHKISTLQMENSFLRRSLGETKVLQSNLQEQTRTFASLQTRVHAQESELKHIRLYSANLELTTKKLNDSTKALEQQNARYTKKIELLEEERDDLRKQLEDILNQMKEGGQKMKEGRAKMEAMIGEIEALKRELRFARLETTRVREELKERVESLMFTEQSMEALEREKKIVQLELEQLQDKHANLEALHKIESGKHALQKSPRTSGSQMISLKVDDAANKDGKNMDRDSRRKEEHAKNLGSMDELTKTEELLQTNAEQEKSAEDKGLDIERPLLKSEVKIRRVEVEPEGGRNFEELGKKMQMAVFEDNEAKKRPQQLDRITPSNFEVPKGNRIKIELDEDVQSPDETEPKQQIDDDPLNQLLLNGIKTGKGEALQEGRSEAKLGAQEAQVQLQKMAEEVENARREVQVAKTRVGQANAGKRAAELESREAKKDLIHIKVEHEKVVKSLRESKEKFQAQVMEYEKATKSLRESKEQFQKLQEEIHARDSKIRLLLSTGNHSGCIEDGVDEDLCLLELAKLIRKKMDSITEQKEEYRERFNELSQTTKKEFEKYEKEATNESLMVKSIEEKQRAMDKMRETLHSMQKNFEELQGGKAHAESKVKKYQEELEQLVAKEERLKVSLSRCESLAQRFQNTTKNYQEKVSALESKNNQYRKRLATMESTNEDLRKTLLERKSQVVIPLDLRNKLDAARAKVAELTAQKKIDSQELEQARRCASKDAAATKTALAEVGKLRTEMKRVILEKLELQKKADESVNLQRNEGGFQINELESTIETLRIENHRIGKQRDRALAAAFEARHKCDLLRKHADKMMDKWKQEEHICQQLAKHIEVQNRELIDFRLRYEGEHAN